MLSDFVFLYFATEGYRVNPLRAFNCFIEPSVRDNYAISMKIGIPRSGMDSQYWMFCEHIRVLPIEGLVNTSWASNDFISIS